MDFTDLQGWAQASKTALDIFKSARDLLPKGPDREHADRAIASAEGIMQRADAQLAAKLGYRLHACTFPPQIMLRKEARKAWVCPGCEHAIDDPPPLPDPEPDDWFERRV